MRCGIPSRVGERRVSPRLRHHTVPRIDEQNGKLRRAGGGHHVARVLLVAGRVGDDELAQRGREIAIRDVDGDALLALGDEAVGQERQVQRRAALLRCALDGGKLVGQDRLGVVEQAADQRALAVVDAARGQEPQHTVLEQVVAFDGGHQK